MAYTQIDNVRIAGLACAVPSFVQEIDLDPERPDAAAIKSFVKNVGVKRRHISITGQTSVDLCFAAAQKALQKAGWTMDSVDAVISLSQTPDYKSPGNAYILNYMLGANTSTMAIDFNIGCSAFPYGITTAGSLLQLPHVNRVLVVASDTVWGGYISKELLLADNSFLFGEGGTAILLEKNNQSPPVKIGMWSDGSGYKYLHFIGGGMRNMWLKSDEELTYPNGETFTPEAVCGIYMDGPEVMSFTTTTVVDAIMESAKHFGTDINEYDGLVLHQANLKIMKVMAKRLKLDMDKVPVTIDRYGNTSAASVSLTIADVYANSEKKNLHLLASGFGIGLSWGVVDLHISSDVIVPVFECDDIFEEGAYLRNGKRASIWKQDKEAF